MTLAALGLIGPVFALAGWTLVMLVWLYALRLPAMSKAKTDLKAVSRGSLPTLPPEVNWPAQNYNHLHEQPTLFYAVAIGAQVIGAADGVAIALAWLYVAIRIAHSLVHALVNVIPARFALFIAGSVTLAALLVWSAVGLLRGY